MLCHRASLSEDLNQALFSAPIPILSAFGVEPVRGCCTTKLHKPHRGSIQELKRTEDVPVVEFMYLVFTGMPGESYGRRLRSLLLCLC